MKNSSDSDAIHITAMEALDGLRRLQAELPKLSRVEVATKLGRCLDTLRSGLKNRHRTPSPERNPPAWRIVEPQGDIRAGSSQRLTGGVPVSRYVPVFRRRRSPDEPSL